VESRRAEHQRLSHEDISLACRPLGGYDATNPINIVRLFVKVIACALVFLLVVTGDPVFCQQSASSAPASQTPATAPQAQAAATGAQNEAAEAPAPNTLLDGTTVKLRLAENLSSETNKTGEQVPFEVTEEVDVDGVPAILKGAEAMATVTEAQPKRRMGRGGKLDVNVDSVRLADGQKAQLRAVRDNSGGGHVGAMTGAMVATSIVFFPAAPLFLFMHGKSVEIPKGTEVTAFVQGDMHLDMAKFGPHAGEADALAATAPSSAATAASLTVDSSVPGADIDIDGAFVGSTPSTISVPPGEHTILVKKKGYADWTRTMNVAGSAVRLNADLEANP
jgi:hypothetical protein